MKEKQLKFLLIFLDWLSCTLAWATFYYFRKTRIEQVEFTVNDSFYYGILFVPIIWLFLYTMQGTYLDVRRLHRMKIVNLTFFGTLLGSVAIFFFLLLDDEIEIYKQYYGLFYLLFLVQLTYSFIPRFILVSAIVKRIHQRKSGFNTLIVGGNEKAVEIFDELTNLPKGSGHRLIGFINLNGVDKLLEDRLNYLGHIDDVERVLREHEIEEVIIAIESAEHDRLKNIIARVGGGDVKIKILPDMYDIMSGSVERSNIFGALLIDVNSEVMPVWQRTMKRLMDIVMSGIALILLTPVFIVLGVMVKLSSPGKIFFKQDRVGKNGRLFKIIKFRTMFVGAEKNGPQLSSSNDPRITNVGKFLRKSRLDEFPQFWNVLKGDMSIVGPRPERQFYIDQIAEIEPQFLQLTKVRPGITSWGQVKYGYAENVQQMLQRMKYDLLYLKNRSLSLDFKIMLYTILIIFKGEGK